MSEEYDVENHAENTKQCEELSSDCAAGDNKPVTNNAVKQSHDIFDVAAEGQGGNQEDKVVDTEREFDAVGADISGKVDSTEKMTSFPSISDDVSAMNVAETGVKDSENASQEAVSKATTSMSDPLRAVNDLNQSKKQTRQSELMFCIVAFYVFDKGNFDTF